MECILSLSIETIFTHRTAKTFTCVCLLWIYWKNAVLTPPKRFLIGHISMSRKKLKLLNILQIYKILICNFLREEDKEICIYKPKLFGVVVFNWILFYELRNGKPNTYVSSIFLIFHLNFLLQNINFGFCDTKLGHLYRLMWSVTLSFRSMSFVKELTYNLEPIYKFWIMQELNKPQLKSSMQEVVKSTFS